ncbi:MAG: hypothetical protein UU34_C0015G0012 [Candidatus Curtissbacteria bacterium GW2011_GWA1_41_11]|uniref:Uncharacterized protein n=1 Tax=Candidatus Curtissbacteria bacterium GW2011_GWA1_41_11 TaxID=1618409 RepID=A0A0G0XFA6_9BACT|nr:MAG: hypothetical protein UU34_C0015G0012 [Candidatus Curtissbacteria bacterium GW2011_GWA1_41_11]
MAGFNKKLLKNKLTQQYFLAHQRFIRRHPHAHVFLKDRGVPPEKLREKAKRLLSTGALTGALLLAAPQLVHNTRGNIAVLSPYELSQELKEKLSALLPLTVEKLSSDQENTLSELFRAIFGIDARAQLDGNRLNHSYGYIGAEQHLPRYPGDTIYQHDAIQQAGITPGRGAWGYFVPSKNQLTDDLVQKEKYYVAVQTMYLPDWNTRMPQLRDWYKYRKVLVVNPRSGKAIVAVVADAGPAKFTGKQFGGSPEVMDYLESKDGSQKGAVVLFFVNDPDNNVPLGPLEYNVERGGAPLANAL